MVTCFKTPLNQKLPQLLVSFSPSTYPFTKALKTPRWCYARSWRWWFSICVSRSASLPLRLVWWRWRINKSSTFGGITTASPQYFCSAEAAAAAGQYEASLQEFHVSIPDGIKCKFLFLNTPPTHKNNNNILVPGIINGTRQILLWSDFHLILTIRCDCDILKIWCSYNVF